MKPTFEVCTTDVLDSMKLLTSVHVLTVDRRSKLCPRYFESEPDFRPIHRKLERLLSKSLTTLDVMTYYLVVHMDPGCPARYPLVGLVVKASASRAADLGFNSSIL